MLRFDVVTIFPEVYESPLRVSLVGKAIAGGLLEVGIHDLRAWGQGPHRKVDDTPFGGGAGMVMTAGPVVASVEAVRRPAGRVVVLSAAGRRFDQGLAAELAAEEQVVLVCGRYEGMDDRVAGLVGAEAVSIGDFVLAGGDVAALVVIEAVARLVPGVLGNLDSLAEESFTGGLLEYPQYTRPAEFRGLKVPEVLLSGDHGEIAKWRRQQRLRRTFEQRPDLIEAAIEAAELSEDERDLVAAWRALLSSNSRPLTSRE
jgi:tRNA (guanine37-N1)-methyltransferase